MIRIIAFAALFLASVVFAVDSTLPSSGYFTEVALETADLTGLHEECRALLERSRRELPSARNLAERLSGDERRALRLRLELTDRLTAYIAKRLADGRKEYLLFAWQGAKELEVLLDYFAEEVRRESARATLKAPACLYAADFGVVADGVTDDRKSLQTALLEASNRTGGGTPVKLILPRGRILVGFDVISFPSELARQNLSPSHLWLTNAVHLTVCGSGASLVFRDATHLGFRAFECSETALEDLSIEYAENPSTQGRVTAVNASPYSIDVEIDDGFPAPDSPRFLNAPSRRFTLSDKGEFVQGIGVMGRVDRLNEPNLFRFTPDPLHAAKEYWHRPKVGNRLSVIARYCPTSYDASAIDFRKSRFCTLRNITVVDSPGVNFRLFNTYAMRLLDCRVLPRKGDLVSSNADGCQVSGPIGPYVARCRFVSMEDDGCNFTSPSPELEDVSKDRLSAKGLCGEASFVTRATDGRVHAFLRRGAKGLLTRPAPEGLFVKKGICTPSASDRNTKEYFGARAKEFARADRCVKIPSDLNGAIVVDTKFENMRGIGIQATAPNMLFENVSCRHTTNGGIHVNALLAWGMNFMPHNIVLRNCRIEDTHNIPIAVGINVMSGLPESSALPLQDILIEDCEITDARPDAIRIRNGIDVTLICGEKGR